MQFYSSSSIKGYWAPSGNCIVNFSVCMTKSNGIPINGFIFSFFYPHILEDNFGMRHVWISRFGIYTQLSR